MLPDKPVDIKLHASPYSVRLRFLQVRHSKLLAGTLKIPNGRRGM